MSTTHFLLFFPSWQILLLPSLFLAGRRSGSRGPTYLHEPRIIYWLSTLERLVGVVYAPRNGRLQLELALLSI